MRPEVIPKNPAAHGPEQAAVARPIVAPKVPAGQSPEQAGFVIAAAEP